MGKYKRSEAKLQRGRRRRKKWMVGKREEEEDERGRKKKGRYEKALGRKGKANRKGSFTDVRIK